MCYDPLLENFKNLELTGDFTGFFCFLIKIVQADTPGIEKKYNHLKIFRVDYIFNNTLPIKDAWIIGDIWILTV